MKIIPAERRHFEKIFELSQLLILWELAEINPFVWSTRAWISEHLGNFFVVEHNGEVLGVMALKTHFDGNMEIDSIVVPPEFQGKGVGKLLIDFAKTFARFNHEKVLSLGTFSVYKKVEFYKSQGFEDLGIAYYFISKYGHRFPYHNMRIIL